MNEFVAQRTDAWRKQRRGKPTASNFHKIYTAGGKASTSRHTYLWQLVAEQIFDVDFGKNVDHIPVVQDGIAREDQAREALAAHLQLPVVLAEFKLSQDRRFGVSPDGYIGNQPVEIKCPDFPGMLRDSKDISDHWPQLQGSLLVHSDAELLHFWSWSPFIEPGAYTPVPRDTIYINGLHYNLTKFCNDLDAAVAATRERFRFDIKGAREFLAERRKQVLPEEGEDD